MTLFAIDQVKVEWEKVEKLFEDEILDIAECTYTTISQFGLLYRHWIATIYSNSLDTYSG